MCYDVSIEPTAPVCRGSKENIQPGEYMKLKNKLLISFCCIVLLPTVLFIIFGAALVQYQVMSIRYQYGVEVSVGDFMPSSTRLFDRMIGQVRTGLERQIREDVGFLENKDALRAYCEENLSGAIDLAFFKNGEVYYETDDLYSLLGDSLTVDMLDDFGDKEARYIGEKCVFVYKLFDTVFPDRGEGSVYAVAYVNQWLPQMKALFVQCVCAILFILMLTASVFTIWIYRSIVKPINVLKGATQKIRDGNLNFRITANEKDELGQLCIGFEQMRQRLKESAEEKVQFDIENKELISNISHDLKTPITAIKGYVEGIMDGVADTPEKLNRYVKTIYNKAIDMDRLIDELTFYSKIDTNRIPYNFNRLQVSEYFSDCAEELSMELESKNIRFQFANYVDESVCVIADPEQLRRVINNIISNSVKYFDKERCYINMRVRDVGDFIQVEIEDNAKGIAQKDLPYIFDRFYRTDSSRNSSKGGSGIGLSIVRKIMEDHGGKIWATSKEGTGTVMYFVLRKYQPSDCEPSAEANK